MDNPVVGGAPHTQPQSLFEQLKHRLIVTVGVLVLCLLLSSGIGIFTLLSQQQLGDQKVAITNDVNTLLQAMIDQETGLRGYVITDNTEFLQPLTARRATYLAAIRHLQQDTQGPDFQATASALALVNQRASNWMTLYANVQIARMQAGDFVMARSDAVTMQGKNLFDRFRATVTQLQAATCTDLATVQTQLNLLNFASLAVAFLLSALALFWLWQTFAHFVAAKRAQLARLKEAANDFGAGHLDTRVRDISDADLLNVAETFNSMAETLEQQQMALRERDILEQLLQLHTALAGSLQLQDLLDSFLRRALPLLDVQMGAFYLYDTACNCLQLCAAQGIAREELPQSCALDEGHLGQAAQQRQPLLVTVPAQQEEQALQNKKLPGQVVLDNMYFVPLLQGESLLGILMVGASLSIREQARNVLQAVAGMIAASVRNMQAYEHIQEQARLLAEHAQEQAQANLILRQQRDSLTTLNAALQEANQARSRFLSTMSHELRTPLTSIIGFAQILLRPASRASLIERQISNIERVLKNAQHLLALINDVLDLAKVEAGRMDVQETTVNLQELLVDLTEETRSTAIQRGLNITVDMPQETILLKTDATKLRQVVLNLLSNALKFTEKGGITLSASLRMSSITAKSVGEVQEETPQVVISVKDTGIGMTAEQQQHIFEAFYQIDSSNTRKYGGTGLGLSIVREFTELLGGLITVESQLGRGTTFTLLLPLHKQEHTVLQDTSPQADCAEAADEYSDAH
jgi:two-component system chemotaxis sensor kinase CheA